VIEQVLRKDFVLEQLERVRRVLEAPPEQRRRGAAPALAPELEPDDIEAAAEMVRAAAEAEWPPPPPGGRRRRAGAAPPASEPYVARDAVISLLQSTLEEYAEEHLELEPALPPPAPQRRGAARADTPAVSDRRLSTGRRGERRIWGRFETTDPKIFSDPGWIASGVAMGIRFFRRPHAFNATPATPCTVGDRLRLVVVSDWGSGLPRAQNVAKHMRAVLDQGIRDRVEQQVVHLGDVYYSGWKREYRKYFLEYWPVREDERADILSWNLNGNHDMYSGGHDYYGVSLRDPRFERQEGSSFFSLQSKHWNVLGLDTAHEDFALREPQPAWVAEHAADRSRKLLLLSHHQLFSAHQSGGPKLAAALEPVLSDRGIDAWYWGHEHRCMLYKPHDGVRAARCVGHGGIPEWQKLNENDPVVEPGSYEYRAPFLDGSERWRMFGFTVLDFDGPEIRVRYIDEDGLEHHTEVLA
jgi:hypothetical protein